LTFLRLDCKRRKKNTYDILSRGDQCGGPIVGDDGMSLTSSSSLVGGGGGIDFSNISFGHTNIAVSRVNNGTNK
jgi:hypothetical protein